MVRRAAKVTMIGVDREWCRIHAEAMKPRRVRVDLFDEHRTIKSRKVLVCCWLEDGSRCVAEAVETVEVVELVPAGFCYCTTVDLPPRAVVTKHDDHDAKHGSVSRSRPRAA